jgi:NADH-quinone oxidoreductase subunit J
MPISFSIAVVVVMAGALIGVIRTNILHAVFGLAISLVGVAGLFFTLNTPFVAVMEVLIYVGGIAVTMIFAVMLSSVARPSETETWGRKLLSALVAGAFFAGGALLITNTNFETSEPTSASYRLEDVGAYLLNDFNLAFETLSVVLLLAIVGAIVISRKEPVLPNAIDTTNQGGQS